MDKLYNMTCWIVLNFFTYSRLTLNVWLFSSPLITTWGITRSQMKRTRKTVLIIIIILIIKYISLVLTDVQLLDLLDNFFFSMQILNVEVYRFLSLNHRSMWISLPLSLPLSHLPMRPSKCVSTTVCSRRNNLMKRTKVMQQIKPAYRNVCLCVRRSAVVRPLRVI